MKLRTQMQDFHGRTLPRSSKPQPHFDFEHDAMAAHALLQAMGEEGIPPSIRFELDGVKDRAAEILAGWLGEE